MPPKHIKRPTTVAAAGTMDKKINEYVGVVNTGSEELSIAHMVSPPGWMEPGQRPDFDEYTVVLKGALHVHTEQGATMVVKANEAVIAPKGEWVQYSTPEGAEYIAICRPAFTPATVHRDPQE